MKNRNIEIRARIVKITRLSVTQVTSIAFGAAILTVTSIFCVSPIVHAAGGQLVGQWKFDETVAGSVAVDSAGSNDAIPTNSPIPSTDVAPVTFNDPRSASFDGTNYFTINRPVSTDFTICAWVKTTSTGGGTDHWTSAPIMDSESGGVHPDFGFGVGNGGRLMFGNGGYDVNNGGLFDAQVNGATPINDNVWHNVCVTRNNTTGQVDLYVDAQLDGSGITGVGVLDSNPNARIGYGYDGAALFSGLIDDVRAYDTALSSQQLEVLSRGGNDPINASVLFDENGGSNVSDITSVQPGSIVTLAAAPVRSGYEFRNWNTAADGSGSSFAAGASYTVPDGETTLYAIYDAVIVSPAAPGTPKSDATDTLANTGQPIWLYLTMSGLLIAAGAGAIVLRNKSMYSKK